MMENTQAPEKPRTDEGLVSELTDQGDLIRGYTQLLMREHQKLGLAQPRVHQCTHAILEQTGTAAGDRSSFSKADLGAARGCRHRSCQMAEANRAWLETGGSPLGPAKTPKRDGT
jgi:hypothetical protein